MHNGLPLQLGGPGLGTCEHEEGPPADKRDERRATADQIKVEVVVAGCGGPTRSRSGTGIKPTLQSNVVGRSEEYTRSKRRKERNL